MATQALKAALLNSSPGHRIHPGRPNNDLGEINKYVNVYFLLNLKAASIKIFDFWTLFSWKKEGNNEEGG